MISLVDRPGCGPRGAGPPVPNRDASHLRCKRLAEIIALAKNLDDPIHHHRLRHSASAAYLKKPFSHNPLIARKLLIRVTNNHATPQPEAGLRPKDFQALSSTLRKSGGVLFPRGNAQAGKH